MQHSAFHTPVKATEQPNYARFATNPLTKPGNRSQSSNVELGQLKAPLQVFRPNEASLTTNNAPNPLTQIYDAATRAFRNSANGTSFSQSLYQTQGVAGGNPAGLSIYQQARHNPSVQLQSVGQLNARAPNFSEQFNQLGSITSVNRSRDFGATRREADNTSVHSKYSTTSKNQLLRPVSINNDEHLFNLHGKEERLAAGNTELVAGFVKNLNATKLNVITNMGQNFKQRITEIWSSYVAEQQKSPAGHIDVRALEADVARINGLFGENLSLRTQQYIEALKERAYRDVFAALHEKNNQRHYLDTELRNLVENDFAAAQRRNRDLREEVERTRMQYESQIAQTEQKYEKLRETHMEMYDREFAFKLNSDEKLVRETLRNAVPALQNRHRKAEEKLVLVQSKSDYRSVAGLKGELQGLEERLREL